MKIINNKEEFEIFYPYKRKDIEEYPAEYPCICKWEDEGGGLTGEYRQVYVLYYPKGLTPEEAFYEGLKGRWIKMK